jgi:hypothetical protein
MALGVWGMVIVFTAANDLGNNLDCIDRAKTVKQIDAC